MKIDSPFINYKVTLTVTSLLQKLFCGVNAGEDGKKCDDETDDPDADDERNDNIAGEELPIRLRECNNLAPSNKFMDKEWLNTLIPPVHGDTQKIED